MESFQSADSEQKKIIESVKIDTLERYVFKNELLYEKVDNDLLIVVPIMFWTQVVRQDHEYVHFGVTKTEARVWQDCWFENQRAEMEEIVDTCLNCIQAEWKQGKKKEGFLHSVCSWCSAQYFSHWLYETNDGYKEMLSTSNSHGGCIREFSVVVPP